MIEVVRDAARLCEYLKRFSPATPFQTPEWLLTWWAHFGSGEMHALAVFSDDEPAGLLPGFVHPWNARRQYTLIGSGISDYLDAPMEQRFAAQVVEAIAEHLSTWRDWDVCEWQDLAAHTSLRALGDVREEVPCMRVALGSSYAEFLEQRPHGLRRNLRRYREKAEALGGMQFSVKERVSPESMDALIHLHRRRWEQSGEPGMIESNHSEPFLRDVVTRLDTLMFTIYIQDRPAAMLLALRDHATVYSYLSAFDPEYEKFGCGRELLARSFEYAHEQGYQTWDFLRGDEPYKLSWGAQPQPKCRLFLEQETYTRPMP